MGLSRTVSEIYGKFGQEMQIFPTMLSGLNYPWNFTTLAGLVNLYRVVHIRVDEKISTDCTFFLTQCQTSEGQIILTRDKICWNSTPTLHDDAGAHWVVNCVATFLVGLIVHNHCRRHRHFVAPSFVLSTALFVCCLYTDTTGQM